MKILNENDMRAKTGGCDASDSPMQTGAVTPCSYFSSPKLQSLGIKHGCSLSVLNSHHIHTHLYIFQCYLKNK